MVKDMESEMTYPKFRRVLVRPQPLKPKYLDGYGGEACERITKLQLRSTAHWVRSALAITLSGVTVFGLLLLLKGKDRTLKSVSQ